MLASKSIKLEVVLSNYRFIQLDVFTEEAFAGNALAVFPEAEGLTDQQMMKIAREMNLSETVFVIKPPASPVKVNAGLTQAEASGPPKTVMTGEITSDSASQATAVAKQPEQSEAPEVLRRLRIFTPAREIPFAGHPVVGTWNALAREGVVP